ncbi:MAG: TRAP transporter large permease subunit, partial [Sphaerochaetaceae bacterium]|nr:TRAP transporter large permease subunit [Sphaerochaetaceae bacterium]
MKKGISVPEVFTKLLLIASSLVFLYTSGFGSFSTLTQRALHWTFMATALFLLMKPKKLAGNIGKYLFAVVAAVTGIYVIYTWPQRIMGIGTVSTLDQVMGITALALLLISVKLSVGWGLTVTASLFLLYAIFGPVFPGFLGHSGVKIPRLINFLYLTAEGMFGVALGISSTYIIVFVIFGAILNALGGGEWFVKTSYALAGRYRGGPAKTAIVASALMGTVSGAPVAN